MATATKKTAKKVASSKKAVVVNKKVKDYGNDPFFVKKAKAMEAVLKKHGLPDSLAQA
jgi:hypothetical protein